MSGSSLDKVIIGNQVSQTLKPLSACCMTPRFPDTLLLIRFAASIISSHVSGSPSMPAAANISGS